MTTSTDMVALYADIAPAFIRFLETERKAIQAEIARFREDDSTASDKNSPTTVSKDTTVSKEAEEPEDATEAVFDPTAH